MHRYVKCDREFYVYMSSIGWWQVIAFFAGSARLERNHLSGEPMSPNEIRLPLDRAWLEVGWSDGSRSTWAASVLSVGARSAGAVRERRARAAGSLPADPRVVGAYPIGNYGVNLAVSDGYDRGIDRRDDRRRRSAAVEARADEVSR